MTICVFVKKNKNKILFFRLHIFQRAYDLHLFNMLQTIMSYETPKVVTVHNPQIGLLRRVLQVLVILYVAVYQLWYAQEDIIATVFLKLSWQNLSLKIFSFEVEVKRKTLKVEKYIE